MKHAGEQALDRLEPMLEALRALDPLDEKKRGVFHVKSRAFLHFHEDPAGLFCDVRLDPANGFRRFRVETGRERSDLMSRIAAALHSGDGG